MSGIAETTAVRQPVWWERDGLVAGAVATTGTGAHAVDRDFLP